jgi:acyl-coenzyme A synthetase/AMP-(fatty) acid ligase
MFYDSDTDLNFGEFRKSMLQFVPKYMIPTKYIRVEKMPMNPNGKIDRLKLNNQIQNVGADKADS